MTKRGTHRAAPAGPTVQKVVVFSAAVLLFVAGGALALAAGPDEPYTSSGVAPIVSDRPVDPTPSADSSQAPVTSGPTAERPLSTSTTPKEQASSRPPDLTRDPAPREKEREAAKSKGDHDEDHEREIVVPEVRDEDEDEGDEHETVVPEVRDEEEHDDSE